MTVRWNGQTMVEGAPAGLGMRHPLGPRNRRRGRYEPGGVDFRTWVTELEAQLARMSAGADPMEPDRREAGYRAQTGRRTAAVDPWYRSMVTPAAYADLFGLTPRQRRRSWQKARRMASCLNLLDQDAPCPNRTAHRFCSACQATGRAGEDS